MARRGSGLVSARRKRFFIAGAQDAGAPWPKDVTLAAADGDWWSLRPLARPTVPAVKDKAGVRNPIDSFILSTLEEKGLAPSPPADAAAFEVNRTRFIRELDAALPRWRQG